ncbi:MAG: hypothetical protein RR505_04580, partial [Raoultibacter sp.]
MMISDFGTLIWLRVRHMRTAFSRMMHLAGTSLADSEQLGDRVYQIYIMAFLLVALGLLWVALLDAVEVVFSDLGASFALLAFQGALAIPVILFVAWGMYALWSTPLKFTHADITYVASSSLDSRALVFVRSGWTMCIGAMVAALAGYALGVGLCSGLGVDSNLLEEWIKKSDEVVIGDIYNVFSKYGFFTDEDTGCTFNEITSKMNIPEKLHKLT